MKVRKDPEKKKQIVTAVVSVGEVIEYLMADRYMGIKEAARYCGLSPDTLDYHSRVVGDLPRIKLAGKILYRKSAIDQFLESYVDVMTSFDPDALAEKILRKLKKKMERSDGNSSTQTSSKNTDDQRK
jgi:hypothetical protein